MRKLALIAAALITITAAPAFADDDHRRDRHNDKGHAYSDSHGKQAKHGKHGKHHGEFRQRGRGNNPYRWVGRHLPYYFAPPRAHFRPLPYRPPYQARHGSYRYHSQAPVLPRRIIARKLRHRDFDLRGRIRYRDGYYRAHAYDRHGRPVKLLINPHNGRIVKRRYKN